MFADNLKVLLTVTSLTDCVLLQTDIDSICNWCATNSVILKIDKTRVTTFTRKTNLLNYNYMLSRTNITRTDCIKDLEMVLDSKLLFHRHVDYTFSKSLKTLGLIRMLTSSFSTIDSLLLLYVTLDLY